ncbi:hypothetical protein K402DRAFT_358751 [Aulographum hederae CBS 113979]|uniref:26S proteasome complex subunit SEM1 n=1 Tax=Aulographum hederae CBS 113979 TaxID=1176131 RepID=A0A6G1GUV4_9PEZI|nr:hypothetical protein K402DRAFT_358751 [Aulographum hederae CBS 113979]
MSASAQGSVVTTKATTNDTSDAQPPHPPTKTPLGEDDEFEDFPAQDWTQEDSELPSGNQHLWEESWDDDNTSDDFGKLLKEEMKKVGKDK